MDSDASFLSESYRPYIRIEHAYTREDRPGVQFYRVRYGGEIMFLGSDGSVDAARRLDEEAIHRIARDFREYLETEDGQDDALRAQQ